MITIINGTNRPGNLSQILSRHYEKELIQLGEKDVAYLSLEDISNQVFSSSIYSDSGRTDELIKLQEEVIIPSDKFVFVLPEYNGGMPGVLKHFIDACSMYRLDDNFKGKKVALLGVAAGRAGNLRGLDHLAGIMNFLGAIVMPNKLPVSSINSLVNAEKQALIDANTKDVIKQHVQSFLAF